ncbi:MAG TPA: hypothetical protein VFF12_19295 [Myxococcaceae bacterium]|nr:hypothetical protein [Myxococcaceae bacterium]
MKTVPLASTPLKVRIHIDGKEYLVHPSQIHARELRHIARPRIDPTHGLYRVGVSGENHEEFLDDGRTLQLEDGAAFVSRPTPSIPSGP